MTLPRPTGPYTVGCTDVEFESLTGRLVLSRIYYPSSATPEQVKDEERGMWLPSSHYYPGYGYYSRIPSWISGPMFRYVAGHVKTWSYHQLALAGSASIKGLILFSHGLGGIRTTYSSVCCELASHGYILAAVEHRDGSAAMSRDAFGRTIEYQRPTPNNEFNFRNAQLSVRIDELEAVRLLVLEGHSARLVAHEAHVLEALRGGLQESPARENVVAMGHSMGAATALFYASKHPVSTVIGLDPWMYPLPADHVLPPGPKVLVISMASFLWPQNGDRIRQLSDSHPGERQWVTVARSDHIDQSDIPIVLPALLRMRMRTRGNLEPVEVLELTRKLCVDFLLKGVLERCEHVTTLQGEDAKAGTWKEREEG